MVRAPERAGELKAKLGGLMSAISRIRALKRSVNQSFWEVGEILSEIEESRLYEAKGYTSFDAFVGREVELPKAQSLAILRITRTFQKGAAKQAGLVRLTAALAALDDGTDKPEAPAAAPDRLPERRATAAIPLHKQ